MLHLCQAPPVTEQTRQLKQTTNNNNSSNNNNNNNNNNLTGSPVGPVAPRAPVSPIKPCQGGEEGRGEKEGRRGGERRRGGEGVSQFPLVFKWSYWVSRSSCWSFWPPGSLNSKTTVISEFLSLFCMPSRVFPLTLAPILPGAPANPREPCGP